MNATGTIFDIKRFAVHDGPGIRTTVFFKGCPLNCVWCHNPESRCPEPESRQVARRSAAATEAVLGCRVTAEEVFAEVMADRLFYEQSGGGVTFSGGEPLMQPEFLESLLDTCRRAAVPTAVDTSGYADWPVLARIAPMVDLFLYDLKLMDDAAHRRHVGVSNRKIHDNLRGLASTGAAIAVRVPLIPGITDTRENLETTAAFTREVCPEATVYLLPYNRLGRDKARRYSFTTEPADFGTQSREDINQRTGWLEALGCTVRVGG